jgi:phosphatidylglycerophosphate synthase
MSIRQRMITAGYLKQSEYFNVLTVALRATSIPFVTLFVRLRIHPNAVTLLSLIAAAAACVAYRSDQRGVFALLWTLSAILDYADGTVARKLGKASYFGYLLDMVGDRVKLMALLLVWGLGTGGVWAYTAASLAIAALATVEVLLHAFVARADSPSVPGGTGVGRYLFEVLLRFDMHTFVVYGLAVALSVGASYIGTGWLVLVLFVSLYRTVTTRLVGPPGTVRLNARVAKVMGRASGE